MKFAQDRWKFQMEWNGLPAFFTYVQDLSTKRFSQSLEQQREGKWAEGITIKELIMKILPEFRTAVILLIKVKR